MKPKLIFIQNPTNSLLKFVEEIKAESEKSEQKAKDNWNKHFPKTSAL